MVAEPPKVTSTFVVLLASLVMQRIFAASLFIIPACMVSYPRRVSCLWNACRLSNNVQYSYHSFFIQLLIVYLSSNRCYAACRMEEFNKAALDGALYLLLFGRLQAHRQRKTGEDLGVIANDLSTHELSFQSRQTISHVECMPIFVGSSYKGRACT